MAIGKLRGTMALLGSLALLGCATPANYTPRTTQISFPELNTPHSVAVGEDMLRQGTSTMTRGIVLSETNRIGFYEFSPGFYPQVGEDREYTYHTFQLGSGLQNGFGSLRIGGGVLAPANDIQSLRASKQSQQLCAMRNFGVPGCDTEHSYSRTERALVSQSNFQQVLLYNGRVGDRVRIGYREFSGDVARPAFSNEVEYDLASSNEISYRGARIRILSADNQAIEYIVLSNFNTPASQRAE